jgi:hypothetical protein
MIIDILFSDLITISMDYGFDVLRVTPLYGVTLSNAGSKALTPMRFSFHGY